MPKNNVSKLYQAQEGLETWVPQTSEHRQFWRFEIYTKSK